MTTREGPDPGGGAARPTQATGDGNTDTVRQPAPPSVGPTTPVSLPDQRTTHRIDVAGLPAPGPDDHTSSAGRAGPPASWARPAPGPPPPQAPFHGHPGTAPPGPPPVHGSTATRPTPPDPGRSARRRVLVPFAAGLLAAALIALTVVGITAANTGDPAAGPTGRPAEPVIPPVPASLIGDPRTADPCSLIDQGMLRPYGDVLLVPDYGAIGTCAVDVSGPGAGGVVLTVNFGAASSTPLAGATQQIGPLQVARPAGGGGECTRTILTPDRTVVYVQASTVNGSTADPCPVADAATTSASTTLVNRAVGQKPRNDPAGALTMVDACQALDPASLNQVSGLNSSRVQPGWGNWSCTWGYNPAFAYAPIVRASVKDLYPLTGAPVRIGDRTGQVTPNSYPSYPNSCTVDLVQRSFTAEDGTQRIEELEILVYAGRQPTTDAACTAARNLALSASTKLPPSS